MRGSQEMEAQLLKRRGKGEGGSGDIAGGRVGAEGQQSKREAGKEEKLGETGKACYEQSKREQGAGCDIPAQRGAASVTSPASTCGWTGTELAPVLSRERAAHQDLLPQSRVLWPCPVSSEEPGVVET